MALVAVCGFRRSLGTGKSLSFVGHHEGAEMFDYRGLCMDELVSLFDGRRDKPSDAFLRI